MFLSFEPFLPCGCKIENFFSLTVYVDFQHSGFSVKKWPWFVIDKNVYMSLQEIISVTEMKTMQSYFIPGLLCISLMPLPGIQ